MDEDCRGHICIAPRGAPPPLSSENVKSFSFDPYVFSALGKSRLSTVRMKASTS